jgi:hypothetical protein
MNQITLPGLLGKGNKGLLPKLQGRDALITITDFSAMLGDETKSESTKTELFNALRDIYDGAYVRDIWPEALSWTGRLSIIASCTPAYDRFTKHSDALGTRWLIYRQREPEHGDLLSMSRMVLDREGLRAQREAARDATTPIIEAARARVQSVSIDNGFKDEIIRAGLLAAYGRASVPRGWNGEIDGLVDHEGPGRIIQNLHSLARGLTALEIRPERVRRIVLHAAYSSIPPARAKVLRSLAQADEPLSTNTVRREVDASWRPIRQALEDMRAVNLVHSERMTAPMQDDSEQGKTDPILWSLSDEHEDFIREVIA